LVKLKGRTLAKTGPPYGKTSKY